ncbi:hypothetical protein FORMB_17180 [Formosa sp. Hel1_33_131]|uniref:hypothetical protein n=1 Tax=Formosa sp. Hel1_33_131 TaxID=1336794 RepID=UPI00084E3004|nr:hypothetical protein [Formosa sp. Hel1_33_131]AOR28757.1 hypothetical protein FORMB_17180 [Formosa sp. Hel1_33_131]
MEIIGIIEQILDKSKPPFKKRVAIVSDSINKKNKWGVEFRKQLAETAKTLRPGDYIKVTCYNDFKIDNHNNYYNNVVAEKVERL